MHAEGIDLLLQPAPAPTLSGRRTERPQLVGNVRHVGIRLTHARPRREVVATPATLKVVVIVALVGAVQHGARVGGQGARVGVGVAGHIRVPLVGEVVDAVAENLQLQPVARARQAEL